MLRKRQKSAFTNALPFIYELEYAWPYSCRLYTLKNDLEVRFRMFDWGRLLKRTVNAQVCFRTGNRTKV
jgi:hypothetical protein